MVKITWIYPKHWTHSTWFGCESQCSSFPFFSNNNEAPAEIVSGDVYLRSEPRGWWISRERSGRCWTGLRTRRWGHCPRARRRAGRRPPPPLLSPPHPGRRSEAATGERGAAAAAGGVQQRAWREGEQAHRHTEPRRTSSGAGEPGPAVCVCVCVRITKASSLSRCLQKVGGNKPGGEKGWAGAEAGCVWPEIVHTGEMCHSECCRDDVAYFCRPTQK